MIESETRIIPRVIVGARSHFANRMPEYGVGIVILDFNRAELLEHCIPPLLDRGDACVFVVENGEPGLLSARLDKSVLDRIVIIEMGQNVGFSRGMNAGVRTIFSKRQVPVLLLNNDVEINWEAVVELRQIIDSDPSIGVAVPNQHPGPRFGPTAHKKGKSIGRGSYSDASRPPREIDRATGFCLMIRPETFLEMGLLDEDFIFGKEDDEFFFRMRSSRFRVIEAPAILVRHSPSTSTDFGSLESIKFLVYSSSYGRVMLARKTSRNVGLTLIGSLIDGVKVALKAYSVSREWFFGDCLLGSFNGFQDGRHARLHAFARLDPPPTLGLED